MAGVAGSILEWPWRDGADDGFFLRLARPAARVLLIVVREFGRDQIPLRAAALAFAVILSLVPVLALGTAVMKGLGGAGHLRAAAHALVDRVGGEEAAAGPEGRPALVGNLHRAVDQVFVYVNRTNFATLGTIGVVGVLWAALSVLGNVERAMNAIWQSKRQRGVFRKLVDYLALTLLLPISINIGFAAMTALTSPRLRRLLLLAVPDPALLARILGLLPAVLLALTFSVLYAFLPNVRVKGKAALVGGVAGAAVWILFQAAYLKLQFGVARYNAIYGSFAILPLFFIWLHVSWMIFLAGAEVSFAVQNQASYQWHGRPRSALERLRMAVDILVRASASFSERKGIGPAEAARLTGAGVGEALSILDHLHHHGLLHRDGELFFPAAPAEKIPMAELAALFLGRTDDIPGPAGMVARAVEDAVRGMDVTGGRPDVVQ